MATIISPEYIYKAMREYGYKYVTVKSGSQTLMLLNDPASELEGNLEKLRELINSMRSGTLKITISPFSGREKKSGTSSSQKLDFELEVSNYGSPQVQQQPVISGPDTDHERRIEERIKEKYELQRSIDKLTDKLENSSGMHPAIEKLITGIAPYVPNIIAQLTGRPQVTVSGDPNEEAELPNQQTQTEKEQEELGRRIIEASNRILQVDPDWATTIEKLADLAESDIEKYNMAKGLLNS